MSRKPDEWTQWDPRDFLEWLLMQLEELSDEKVAYERRAGRPWDQKDRDLFETLRNNSDEVEKLFDVAGAEWSAAQVGPLARHVRDYLAGHWSRERPGPVLVFPEPAEEEEGAEAPGKDIE